MRELTARERRYNRTKLSRVPLKKKKPTFSVLSRRVMKERTRIYCLSSFMYIYIYMYSFFLCSSLFPRKLLRSDACVAAVDGLSVRPGGEHFPAEISYGFAFHTREKKYGATLARSVRATRCARSTVPTFFCARARSLLRPFHIPVTSANEESARLVIATHRQTIKNSAARSFLAISRGFSIS